jgi:hypothetical protein
MSERVQRLVARGEPPSRDEAGVVQLYAYELLKKAALKQSALFRVLQIQYGTLVNGRCGSACQVRWGPEVEETESSKAIMDIFSSERQEFQ